MSNRNSRSDESLPVTRDTPLEVDDPLWVEWNGTWYEGTVVSVLRNGRVRIHYVGWDDSFDEVVPRKRLRLGAPPEESEVAEPVTGHGAPAVYQDTLQGLLFSGGITEGTELKTGDKLLAEWNGTWWAAEVVQVQKDGVKIHYVGWDKSWDEVAPRSRLRLPITGPRRITVYFDCDWHMTGELVQMTPEVLIIKDEEEQKQRVITRSRIVYFELETPARD
jgi:hypothetical protein